MRRLYPVPMAGSFFALTDLGRRRSNNQDFAIAETLDGQAVLLVVADGVGGAPAGDVASREAVESLRAAISAAPGEDPLRLLPAAIAAANEHVLRVAAGNANYNGMSTTAVVALIRDGMAWVAGIGDSRGFALDGGDVVQLTEDDSFVAEQVRAGAMTAAEAERSPYSNIITRCIGSELDLPDEDVVTVKLSPGAMIVLATDGLFRVVGPGEMAVLLRQGSVEDGVRALIERANANGGPDNIGIAAYREPLTTETE